jgi:hypothetical protein
VAAISCYCLFPVAALAPTSPEGSHNFLLLLFLFCVCVCVGLGFEIRLHACKVGALPLEPHRQSILLWLFWRQGLGNYLLGLASNLDPPIFTSQLAGITSMSHYA